MAVLVTTDGAEPQYVHLSDWKDDDDNDYGYRDVEKILGRGAERLDLLDWVNFAFDVPTIRYWYAYLSRDRFIMKQPFNKRASDILGMTVFGNVIFASAKEAGEMPLRETELRKKEKIEEEKIRMVEREKQALARRRKFQRDNILWWLQGFGIGLLFALGEALVIVGCIRLLMYFGYITWNV